MSVRRAIGRADKTVPGDRQIDPLGTAIAAAHHRARQLHIPESAIARQLDQARRRGQSELSAMTDLLAQAGSRTTRG